VSLFALFWQKTSGCGTWHRIEENLKFTHCKSDFFSTGFLERTLEGIEHGVNDFSDADLGLLGLRFRRLNCGLFEAMSAAELIEY
jgi:hypothetical protein